MSNLQQSTSRVVAIRQPFALFAHLPWRPSLNVYKTEQGIHLVAELAGIALDELQVDVFSTNVQIHGTRQMSAPRELDRIQQIEILSGPFKVEVPLTTPIDPDRSEALYRNGLLDIWLPFAGGDLSNES